MVIVTHDLDDIVFEMEDAGIRKENMTAQCPHCQETHRQDMNLCTGCDAHIVWLHSIIWKRAYGAPHVYLNSLRHDLKPITPTQAKLAAHFGRNGQFQNITQKKKAQTLERGFPDSYLEMMAEWSWDKGWHPFVSAVENTDNYQQWLREEGIGEESAAG